MGYDLHDRLNWQQACTLLGCKKTKFYTLIREGKLTAHRVGPRNLWVSRAECQRLIEGRSLPMDETAFSHG